MSWRVVVISSNAKLDYQLGFLVVRKDTITKIYLNEISVLMLESTAISLTASLVSELLKRKIKIIFCDEKRNPCGEVTPYYGSYDSSAKIRNQIAWEDLTTHRNYSREDPKTKGVPGKAKEKRRGFVAGIFK